MATHYTLCYTDGNENPCRMPLDSYDTIQDCVDWADEHSIDYYLLIITEWDGEEIIAQVNLDAPANENQREDLTKYIL